MDEILKKVSVADEATFRARALQELGWTRNQYNNRVQGRTRVTPAERVILLNIANKIRKQ